MEFQCRGDCPASLHLLLFVCGKHSAPSRTPFRQATKTVRLPTGIGVHLQTGMLFGITTESCSASQRNRVRLRPDSPEWAGQRDSFTLPPSNPERCTTSLGRSPEISVFCANSDVHSSARWPHPALSRILRLLPRSRPKRRSARYCSPGLSASPIRGWGWLLPTPPQLVLSS